MRFDASFDVKELDMTTPNTLPQRSLYTIYLYMFFLWGAAYYLANTDIETLHEWFLFLQASSFESFVMKSPRFAAVQNYLIIHDTAALWEKVVCFLALICAGFLASLSLMICLFCLDVKRHWKTCTSWQKPDYIQRLAGIKWAVLFLLLIIPASYWFFLVKLPNFQTYSKAREWLIEEHFGFFFFSFQVLWFYLITVILTVFVVRAVWDIYLRYRPKDDDAPTPPSA